MADLEFGDRGLEVTLGTDASPERGEVRAGVLQSE